MLKFKPWRPVLKHKRDLTTGGLAAELDDICVLSNPAGGLFIWLRMPDDVDRKKPDPEIYNVAAERLGATTAPLALPPDRDDHARAVGRVARYRDGRPH